MFRWLTMSQRGIRWCVAAIIATALLSAPHCAVAAESGSKTELPPLGPDVPRTASEFESKLKYSWTRGEQTVYEYTISIDIAKEKLRIQGRNRLKLSDSEPAPDEFGRPEQRGTGSGFVVHPEGIIVTCAHVVRGATAINAKIGDREYKATAIAVDFEEDIAILRVKGDDLPYVTFADSNEVRLADEVRAIGFPLTEVLGESIKVTRGEISGMGGPYNKSGLQIDASINPGNSGGPIVDTSGRVVGVTSSLLSGAGISEVGFAVPSNLVQKVLTTLDVPFAVSTQSNPQSAADVVAKVVPACVLISATYGADGLGSGELSKLDYSSFWFDAAPPRLGALRRPSLPKDGRGSIILDQSGDVLDGGAEPALPCLLGSGGLIGIEKLPSTAPGTTKSTSALLMQRVDEARQGDRFSPYGFRPSYRYRLGSPLFRDREPPSTVQLMTGTESTEYVFGAPKGDLVDLTKTYEMQIDGDNKGEEPYLRMTGKGTGKFNLQTGKMQSLDFRGQLVIAEDNVTVRVPVRMQYDLMSTEELAKEEQQRLERAKEREKLAAERERAEDRASNSPRFGQLKATSDSAEDQPTSVKSIRASTKLNKFNPNK